MSGGGEKTEKATPKKRADARKKGQVARSADLTGALVMLAGLMMLAVAGPGIAQRLGDAMRECFALIAKPEAIEAGGLGEILLRQLTHVGLAIAPVAGGCMVMAVIACVGQVGFKPSGEAVKPDPKRINPASGFKNIFGPNAIFEAVKSVSKVAVVGAIVFAALYPRLPEFGALVGIEPIELGMRLGDGVRGLAWRACLAYLLIGIIDFAYQRWRHEKQLRMDHQEVKEEQKQQALPAEVRGQIRRRQIAASRARMMAAIPEADVVVTNPTHFSVALKYDGAKGAPEVVAKGQDILALRIRELAKEHDVPVIPEPPLARSLYATVEVGHEIPEELYHAVAQVLAFVYRLKPRAAAA